MSLIQEALKRQQRELAEATSPDAAGKNGNQESTLEPNAQPTPAKAPGMTPSLKTRRPSAPATGNTPPAETPATKTARKRVASEPLEKAPDPESKPYHMLSSLIGVLLLLVLLAGAFVWAVDYGLQTAGIVMPWHRETQSPIAQHQRSATETLPESLTDPVEPGDAPAPSDPATNPEEEAITEVPPDVPSTRSARVLREALALKGQLEAITQLGNETEILADDATTQTGIRDNAHDLPPPSVTADIPETTSEQAEQAVTATADRAETPTAPPETIITRSVWPDVVISGIVGSGDKGAVYIDGKVLGVSESIHDIKVISIAPQGVLLEYDGEKRLVRIGQTIQNAPTR